MRIDGHQHFWVHDPVRDTWITDDMSVLRRNYLPADLEPELEPTIPAGTHRVVEPVRCAARPSRDEAPSSNGRTAPARRLDVSWRSGVAIALLAVVYAVVVRRTLDHSDRGAG